MTYNCVTTLERTISSVIDQKYNNIEYIVIDGNSTDGTKEIIEKYSDDITHYVSEDDNGIYNAMNKGILLATNDVVCFINGDDYYLNDSVFDTISEQFENSDAEIIADRVAVDGIERSYCAQNQLSRLKQEMILSHQGIFVKRELFERIGLFNEKYKIASDYEWLLDAYLADVKFDINDTVVAYFSSGGASSDSLSHVECCKIIFSKDYCSEEEKQSIKEKYIKAVKDTVLVRMLRSENNYLSNFFYNKKIKSIWGTGIWSRRLFDYICRNGFTISQFIESNKNKVGMKLSNIPILKYNKQNVELPILIATTAYENEIALLLENDGFVKNRDFYTISDIENGINYSDTKEIVNICEIENL